MELKKGTRRPKQQRNIPYPVGSREYWRILKQLLVEEWHEIGLTSEHLPYGVYNPKTKRYYEKHREQRLAYAKEYAKRKE